MFTGLVSDVGIISGIEDTDGLRRIRVDSAYPVGALQMGASVMHSGVCLTLVEFGSRSDGSWWIVEAIPETLQRTILGSWAKGSRCNLELSLKVGDEIGGHLVSGHVDAVGTVTALTPDGDSTRIRVGMPKSIARFLAEKGSICIDGVSLTVTGVGCDDDRGDWFEVAVIPHTQSVTSLGQIKLGDMVNLEVDMLARYVARMLEART